MKRQIKVLVNKGGPGSGHFGHAGRPGKVGGSSNEPYTDSDKTLIEHLSMISKMSEKSTEHLVLKHGKRYNPINLPREYKMGEKKMCYMNAFHIVDNNPDLTYVEGFAMPDFMDLPISHAWAVDSKGNVIDNTWDTPGSTYIGVPFNFNFVRKVISETETYGIFGYNFRDYFMDGMPDDAVEKELMRYIVVRKGGKGSGHHGHAGIPGEVGGSLPGNAVSIREYTGKFSVGQKVVRYSKSGNPKYGEIIEVDPGRESGKIGWYKRGKPGEFGSNVSKLDKRFSDEYVLDADENNEPKTSEKITSESSASSGKSSTGIVNAKLLEQELSYASNDYFLDMERDERERALINHANNIQEHLGLSRSFSVVPDDEMDEKYKEVARRIGVIPSEIKGVYDTKTDSIELRYSLIQTFNANGVRLLMNVIYHEIGHAYDRKYKKTAMSAIRSAQDYQDSAAEEFAEEFSYRLASLRSYLTKPDGIVLANLSKISRNSYAYWVENVVSNNKIAEYLETGER